MFYVNSTKYLLITAKLSYKKRSIFYIFVVVFVDAFVVVVFVAVFVVVIAVVVISIISYQVRILLFLTFYITSIFISQLNVLVLYFLILDVEVSLL